MKDKLSDWWQQVDAGELMEKFIIPWGTNLIFAILIFVIGRLVSKLIVKAVNRLMRRSQMDIMLIEFVVSILGWVLFLVVLVAALDRLGLDTTSLIAVLGAAGLAIGLALKDSLQNFASGVMLILFRPFRVGDTINAAGSEGVVEEVRIFSTLMRTPDNRELTIPNGAIFGDTITNVTAREKRRIDLVIGVGYDDDLREAKAVLERVIKADERVLEEPAPLVAVGDLGDSCVNILVRPWVKTPDFFATKCALTEAIKLALDEAGISIPYPQRDLHVDGKLG